MNKHLRLSLLLVLVLLPGLPGTAAPDEKDLPPADLNRVREDTVAPDFTLADLDGTPVALSSFRGKKKVVLVFYRGYW